jgi:hypothetical protein
LGIIGLIVQMNIVGYSGILKSCNPINPNSDILI